MDSRERPPSDASLVEIIETMMERRLAGLHVAMPVRVTKDSDGHTVSLQPLIQRTQRMPDGTEKLISYPEIQNAPVQFSSGGGSTFTHPIKEHDEGIIITSSRAIDAWHQQGGEQAPVDARSHNLADAFYIPGVRSDPRKLKDVSPTAAQMRSDDGEHSTGVDPAKGVATKTSKNITDEADGKHEHESGKVMFNCA